MPDRPFARLVFGTLLLVVAGCGGGADYEGPPRAAVRGRVTFDKMPVESGSITFVPDGEGRKASGRIVSGAYDIPEPQGPQYGDYRVEILWERSTGKTITAGTETAEVTRQVIPGKYNENTELRATVTDDPEKNVFDFDLTSK